MKAASPIKARSYTKRWTVVCAMIRMKHVNNMMIIDHAAMMAMMIMIAMTMTMDHGCGFIGDKCCRNLTKRFAFRGR